MFELRHLRTFVEVAECLNFSVAAKSLRIAQPAVSKTIRDLEEALELKLFVRDTRSVNLTTAGKTFYKEALQTLTYVEESVIRTRLAQSGEHGHLSIAYMGSAAGPFLPLLVACFREAFPSVELELQEMVPSEQLAALANGKIDLGFTRPLMELGRQSGIKEKHYLNDKLLLVLPVGHACAAHSSVDIRTLENEPFVIFARESSPPLFDQAVGRCIQAGFSPKIVAQPKQMTAVLTSVACGVGVSIIPSCVGHLQREGLCYRRIHQSGPPVPLHLAWNASSENPTREKFKQMALLKQAEIIEIMESRESRLCEFSRPE